MNFWSNHTKEVYHVGAKAAARDGALAAISRLRSAEACVSLGSSPQGLLVVKAATRLKKFGPNLVARERKPTIAEEVWNRSQSAKRLAADSGSSLLRPWRFACRGRDRDEGDAGHHNRFHPGTPVE